MTDVHRWRLAAVAAAVIVACVTGSSLAQVGPWPPAPEVPRLAFPPDFPLADEQIWQLEQTGLRIKLVREVLVTAPDALSTLHLLVDANRTDEAIEVLGRIIDRHQEDLQSALQLGATLLSRARADYLRPRDGAIGDLAARMRLTLQRLPREEAALAARLWLLLEIRAVGGPAMSRDERRTRLTGFAADWNGTAAALLAQVDLVAQDGPPSQRKLDALETLAKTHPHTLAAARAQFARGFDLAFNGMVLGDRAGSDPLKRFQTV